MTKFENETFKAEGQDIERIDLSNSIRRDGITIRL